MTDMRTLAARLMQTNLSTSNLPTAIFGSADTLSKALEINRPPVRIGIWPIVCPKAPEVAMGVATLLAFLLERYNRVRVYRLFARLNEEPHAYRWRVEDSQFDVDDWQLDDLDENVALWGTLTQTTSDWTLQVSIENDLAPDGDDLQVFYHTASDLAGLVASLPELTDKIASYLEAGEVPIAKLLYESQPKDWPDERLERLLRQAFVCELRLFLSLWGQSWDIDDDFDALVNAAIVLGEMGEWVVSNVLARLISRGADLTETNVSDMVDLVINSFPTGSIAPIVLAGSLYRSGYAQECFSLLEDAVEQHPADTLPRVVLSEFLREGGRLFDALDVLQQAVEEEVVGAYLYVRYANLLSVLDYNGMVVEDFVLIDMTQRAPNLLALEALAAYTAALELEPDNVEALFGQLMQLIDIGSVRERFWAGFARLVEADSTGEYVRNVIDGMDAVDDIQPGISILERAAAQHPDRLDMYINLGCAYILEGEGDAALQALEHARSLTNDRAVLADLERLALSAEDPDFESRLGEIIDLISAGSRVDTDDAEYLETIISRAPTLAEAYVLLAKTYAGWGEVGSVLETLLDGYRHVPHDAEMIFLLAQTLWDSGEHDLALNYLTKGIAHNPNHVPLLALMGRCLFDTDRDQEARAYLTRAELIAPRDPTLNEVRAYIASKVEG